MIENTGGMDDLYFQQDEPGILKQKMLEILEHDPWNIMALSALSEIEFGDISRLYRLDALRGDPSDTTAASKHLVWEINEETMRSEKTDVGRLSFRFSTAISIAFEEHNGDLSIIADIIEDALLEMKNVSKTKELIVAMKASLLLEESIPNTIENILARQISGTKTAITELLRSNEDSLPEGFTHRLLVAAAKNPYLFTDLRIRQNIAGKILQLGYNALAFWLAMKSIEINPQDGLSSKIALEAATSLGDDRNVLYAASAAMSMKKEPKGIKYGKIAAAAIRTGRIGYAKDLLLRRRMKLNLEGHRQRIGICYHEGDPQGVFEEVQKTPLPHKNDDSVKSYNTLAIASQGEIVGAIKSIEEISDALERNLLEYYCHHLDGNYNRALWSLNSHFSKRGMAIIDNSWGDEKCNFLGIRTVEVKKSKIGIGLVSVIMTCHR